MSSVISAPARQGPSLFSTNPSSAAAPTFRVECPTFSVDAVTANRERLPTLPTELKSLGARFAKKNVEAFGVSGSASLVEIPLVHGLVATIGKAYDEHFPLELSPSDMHLALLQAFGQHIEANSDRLRNSLVTIAEGKLDLEVYRDDFRKGLPSNPWPEVFGAFCEQLKTFMVDDLKDAMTRPYSNSTPTEIAAIHVTLMSSMKAYFKYILYTRCGIPEVRLTGTQEDWNELRIRMDRLSRVDPSFRWWFQAVDLVLHEFQRAFSGHVNLHFWQRMFKEQGGSGTPRIRGWINLLFPYSVVDGRLTPNYQPGGIAELKDPYSGSTEVVMGRQFPVTDDLTTLLSTLSDNWSCSTSLSEVPVGLSNCPFVWKYIGQEFQMSLEAGFLGVAQTDDGFLKPAMGWLVVENQTKSVSEEDMRSERSTSPAKRQKR